MNTVLDAALSLLFPQRLCCHGCGCILSSDEGLLCAVCQQALDGCTLKRKDEERRFQGAQVLAAAAYAYAGLAADLTQSLKYLSDRAAAHPLAIGMARRFAMMPALRTADLCVFVPSHPRQAERRGYVQAQVLCGAFAEITGLPQADALRRVRYAESQVGLSREERGKQIVGAFALDEDTAPALRERRVLLIDDVLTTGATVCECARMLYAAGALRVFALTACRA